MIADNTLVASRGVPAIVAPLADDYHARIRGLRFI
jgi:hypothetical protein